MVWGVEIKEAAVIGGEERDAVTKGCKRRADAGRRVLEA
jgi:hypothetical protein